MAFLLASVTGHVFLALRFCLFVASAGIHESDLTTASHLALPEPRVVRIVGEAVVCVFDRNWSAIAPLDVVILDAFDELPEPSAVRRQNERNSEYTSSNCFVNGHKFFLGQILYVTSL